MNNVLVIGDAYVDTTFFEADIQWFHIGKESPAFELTLGKTLRMASCFDVEEYDKKMLEIFLFCDEVIAAFGKIDYVIANTEHTILCGAAVRDHYLIPGRRIKDVAVFRNKFLMKSALAHQGKISTSRFIGGETLLRQGMDAVVREFTAHDYPLVVKATAQAGSRHVHVVYNIQELSENMQQLKSLGVDFLVEQYVDAPVIHIDGVCRQGELLFVCASRYLDDCYAWQHKKIAMSSILIDDALLRQEIVRFTQDTLSALQADDIVFHLEAFLLPDHSLVFLEIASRPGGAAIAPCIKSIYGVDLMQENFKVEVQAPSVLSSSGFLGVDVNKSGGWIVLALRETQFCEVLAVNGDPQLCEWLVWKKVVCVGTRYNQEYFEDPAVGMFVVQEHSANEVAYRIQQIKQAFSLEVRRLA